MLQCQQSRPLTESASAEPMNVKIISVTIIGLLEIGKIALAQAQVVPPNAWEIFKDFPLLTAVMVIVYFMARWFEKILNDQRKTLTEIYDGNQKFLLSFLKSIEDRQNATDEKISALTKETEMMRATLGEAVNVRDIVDQLMDRLAKKTE